MDRPATGTPSSQPATRSSESSGYEALAAALIPAWRRILGPAPWWRVARTLMSRATPHPRSMQQRLSAALGLVLTRKIDQQQTNAPSTFESEHPHRHDDIRFELVQWRAALDPDARPKHLRTRGSPLWPIVAQQVVRLLDHAPDCQSTATLNELERHLRWLGDSRPRSPWPEAAIIEALGCGAVLVRNSTVLHAARDRLRSLLNRQTDEGWFPERGAADMGRLSLMLDGLARLWCDLGWDELHAPLEKAVQFLGVFIETNAADVPCINARGTSFVAPYGIERLAVRIPQAAQVADLLKNHLCQNQPRSVETWDVEQAATLGASIALTANYLSQHKSSTETPTKSTRPHRTPREASPREDIVFHEAGLHIIERKAYRAVISSNRGGMIFIRWTNGLTIEDAGITVIFPHTIRTSSRTGMSDQTRCEPDTHAWRGLLTRVRRRRPGIILQLWRNLQRTIRGKRKRTVTARFHTDGARGRQRLLHDWFSREIILGESEIRIRDQVLCRLPCEALIVGDPNGPAAKTRRQTASPEPPEQTPLIVEGGRTVAVTRTYRDGLLIRTTVERQVDIV